MAARGSLDRSSQPHAFGLGGACPFPSLWRVTDLVRHRWLRAPQPALLAPRFLHRSRGLWRSRARITQQGRRPDKPGAPHRQEWAWSRRSVLRAGWAPDRSTHSPSCWSS